MAKRQEKRVRKLKKNHTLASLITYLIIIAMIAGVTALLIEQVIYFIVQSKIMSEYNVIDYMARIYDNEDNLPATEKIYKVMGESDRPFIVKDADGNIIYEKGENTCSDEGDKAIFTAISSKVMMYKDTEYGYVYADESGTVIYDLKNIVKMIFKLIIDVDSQGYYKSQKIDGEKLEKEIDEEDDFEDELDTQTNKYYDEENVDSVLNISSKLNVKVPVWMSVNIENETKEFIGKGYLIINIMDIVMVLFGMMLVSILCILLFIIMLISTISSIVRQRRMYKLFFTDMVTKGHNWMWFLYKGEGFLRKRSNAKKTFAVVNIVFVNYRNYCICHSIEQGEMMLKKVYMLLSKHLEKKEMVAHASNSNFAMLLKYDDIDMLKMRLQSIVLELEKIDPNHVFSFQVGAIPIHIYKNEKGRVVRRKNIDLEFEYNNACAARATLAESDESGVVLFDEKLIEDQKWIDKVTERQRYALEHEEFIVYYQPKYDPATNKLKGAEALVRWQNDDMGFVPPGRFIPIFEKNGFITEIDHYMLEHVAKDQKAWLDKGCKCVPVSVNVSRAHFIESDLAEQIRDIVDKAGTPHKYIEIELTESAFFDDKKALITTISRLKEYGFAVSMDDFGSGYSSLNSLKDLPLDVLKLDAEFFRGDTQGTRGELVVSEAIKLAKSLNMRTVAEGVEIKEQVDFLAAQGCDMIQGYYFAKPMPKEEYEKKM